MNDRSRQRRTALVLTFTPINREPRALREIDHLRLTHDVTTAGFGSAPRAGLEHIELVDLKMHRILSFLNQGLFAFLLLVRWHSFAYAIHPRTRMARRTLRGRDWDVIVTHDVITTPLALSLDAGPVIVDLHEYAPRQGEDSRRWRILMAPYFRWILRRHVRRAAGVVSVAEGIAEEYRTRFGIDSTVIPNATAYAELEPRPVGTPLRLVHSGLASPARRLDVIVDAVLATKTPVTLDLYLMDHQSAHADELRARAAGDDRIRFPEPVAYADLVPTLNTYDVGVSYIAPTTFNLTWCLPNKFFDFVQARLAIVTGPSPEMARIVREHDLGIIADDFSAEALAAAFDQLTPEQVAHWKDAASGCARDLSAESQMSRLDAAVERVER